MRFMCYLNWTEQGARAMKDAPKRYEASRAIVEKLGGRIVSAYETTGQYDVALTLDMPNGDAMTQFVVSLSSQGNARTTTVRAWTPEEFGKLAAEAP